MMERVSGAHWIVWRRSSSVKHNEYIFSNTDGRFTFLRQFDDMYRNCDDPHGQSAELSRTDYQIVTTLLARTLSEVRRGPGPVRILDAGCGLGYFTAHIKQLFPEAAVFGCDISATAVERARARSAACEFFTADLKDSVTLTQSPFDVLVALDVLYYFTNDEIAEVVRNLHRLVIDEGFLLVGYHLPATMSFGRYIQSLADASRLFEPNGFKFRLTLDLTNSIDSTYAGEPVGRHIYFLAQKAVRQGR